MIIILISFTDYFFLGLSFLEEGYCQPLVLNSSSLNNCLSRVQEWHFPKRVNIFVKVLHINCAFSFSDGHLFMANSGAA